MFPKLVIMMACALSASVFAADTVTINVTGNVVASPCTVNGGSSTLDVKLGDIQAATLSAAGAVSTAVPFSLKFTDCPAGTKSVSAAFSGTPDPDAGGYYKNNGTAKNVAIGIYQTSTGFGKGNGTNIVQDVQADHTVTMDMQAKAYSSAGGATPGTITGAIVVTMSYN
ncbi:MAG TPA: fimbrial protein [Scandinavium sp.]|jgi:minor fimbrial subunit|uniref:fimbrial protein n=1 Tax=Scandinavium sp. TaxID=2830653 RepID=UPI002E3385B8|nr:fimbrial protein [Scandinavium sp.]HEX4503370.1 fimbrial protein [Scandinavium sp.]